MHANPSLKRICTVTAAYELKFFRQVFTGNRGRSLVVIKRNEMKKQLFTILFAVIAISCTKEQQELIAEEQMPAPKITFAATTGEGTDDTKSYIGATEGTSSILWWSPYDALGIYSYTSALGTPGCKLSESARSVLISKNQQSATFDGTAGQWDKEPSENYCFYAYYPELSETQKSVSDGIVSGFSVPSFQVKSFGYYHICSTEGYGEIAAAEMYDSKSVDLTFCPRTALFTIKVYIDEQNTEFEEVQLSYVKVSFEGSDGSKPNVTGDCTLNLANGELTYTGNGSNVIKMSMNDYYDSISASKVKKQKEGVKAAAFDMVLLPLENFSGKVSFEFFTSQPDVSIPSVVKEISDKSFISGKHYSSPVYISPVKRAEAANSYIVDATKTSSISLPIMQGARGWEAIDKYNKTTKSSSENFEDRFWQALDGEVTGELLWSETNGMSISCTRNGDFLDVNFSGSKNGSNALVALKDTKGNVLWSWHIWFTDYNPDVTPDPKTLKVTNGYVHKYQGAEWTTGGIYADKYIMDRNLGAKMTNFTAAALPNAVGDQTHSGLYYQYGRKDPFRPGKYTTEQGPVTIENGAANPTVFYYRKDGMYDWAVNTDHTNTDPWAGGDKDVLPKSAFDPCPAGWRVPVAYMSEQRETFYTWSDFLKAGRFIGRNVGFYYRGTSTSNGSQYDCGNTAYPPCGRLSYASGELASTETTCLWSSSPQPSFAAQSGSARFFISSASYLGWDKVTGKIDAGSRAAGMPVRCIKE